MEFRCESRIHGVVVDGGRLIVRCHSKRCGHGGGVVVEHCFALATGELIETRKFRDPIPESDTRQKEDEACRL